MPRVKIIEDRDIERLIREYYKKECRGNTAKLTNKNITAYINEQGYPDLQEYIIRRNPTAKKVIAELKANEEKPLNTLVAFETIDVRKFVEEHPTEKKMIAGITALNNYYKEVAESALKIFSDFKAFNKRIAELEELNERLERDNKSLKERKEELEKENVSYKNVVNKYVYPEIANALLKEQGINAGTTEHIVKEPEIIRPDTEIPFTRSMLKVIHGGK